MKRKNPDLYVSLRNGKDTNDGSGVKPFKTIDKAIREYRPSKHNRIVAISGN